MNKSEKKKEDEQKLMSIRIYIIDDIYSTWQTIREYLDRNDYKYEYTKENMFPEKFTKKSLRKFLSDVLGEMESENSNLLIIDSVLTSHEEKLIKDLDFEELSGFQIAAEIKRYFPDMPVLLMSRFSGTKDLIIKASQLGCEGFFEKQITEKSFLSLLRNAFCLRKPDIALYLALEEILYNNASDQEPVFVKKRIRKASKKYYTQITPTERFSALAGEIAAIVSPIIQSDVPVGLAEFLAKGEPLFSAAKPEHRDHTIHSGNLYFLGYFLLHRWPMLLDLQSDTYKAAYQVEKSIGNQKHIQYAWMLAALNHDIGYIEEGISEVNHSIKELRDIMVGKKPESKNHFDPPLVEITPILEYLEKIPEALPVRDLLVEINHKWATTKNGKPLWDHGVQSASVFLEIIKKFNKKTKEDSDVILHAASAIAIHNVPQVIHKFGDRLDTSKKVALPFKALPVAGLLMLCDTLQAWARELDGGVFNSRISQFNFDQEISPVPKLSLAFQYYYRGQSFKDIFDSTIEEVEKSINDWKNIYPALINDFLGLAEIINVHIDNFIGSDEDPIVVQLGKSN